MTKRLLILIMALLLVCASCLADTAFFTFATRPAEESLKSVEKEPSKSFTLESSSAVPSGSTTFATRLMVASPPFHSSVKYFCKLSTEASSSTSIPSWPSMILNSPSSRVRPLLTASWFSSLAWFSRKLFVVSVSTVEDYRSGSDEWRNREYREFRKRFGTCTDNTFLTSSSNLVSRSR